VLLICGDVCRNSPDRRRLIAGKLIAVIIVIAWDVVANAVHQSYADADCGGKDSKDGGNDPRPARGQCADQRLAD